MGNGSVGPSDDRADLLEDERPRITGLLVNEVDHLADVSPGLLHLFVRAKIGVVPDGTDLVSDLTPALVHALGSHDTLPVMSRSEYNSNTD